MIKFIVFCTLLYFAAGQQHQPGCHTDADCGENECCTNSMFGRRKRFIFDDLIHSESCRPLAQEGHTCEPDLLNLGGSHAHSFGCPCAPGLECHGDREAHDGGSHSYTNPKCIPEGTYQGGSGTGSATNPTNPPVQTQPPVVDPNQPVVELPGK